MRRNKTQPMLHWIMNRRKSTGDVRLLLAWGPFENGRTANLIADSLDADSLFLSGKFSYFVASLPVKEELRRDHHA